MATTELYQLLKLPFLVEHFMEHKEQNKEITLMDFLYLHYAHGDVKDADYEEDMKLPFKSHSNSVTTSIVDVVANTVLKIVIHPKPNFVPLKVIIISEEAFFASSYHSNIWQPPKFC
jgi:hypothetical protein